MMIKDIYVSYETAELLKECGLPQHAEADEIRFYYSPDEEIVSHEYANQYTYTAMPTQATAAYWLREVKGIHVQIDVRRETDIKPFPAFLPCALKFVDGYRYLPIGLKGSSYAGNWSKYENAMEAGIKAVCKYLLKSK